MTQRIPGSRCALALTFIVVSTLGCAIGSPGLTSTASAGTAVSLPPTESQIQGATQSATASSPATDAPTSTSVALPTNTLASLPTITLMPSPTLTLVTNSAINHAGENVPSTPPPGLQPTGTTVETVGTETSQPSGVVIIPPACALNSSWIPYTIQPGDTLYNISVRAGITLQALEAGNCMVDSSAIYAGETLLVPASIPLSTLPTTFYTTPGAQAATPVPADSQNAALCPDPNARITSPVSGSTFSGKLTLIGSANIPNFSYYVIDYRFYTEWDKPFNSYGNNYNQVVNGVLAAFDPVPGHLPPGGYTLRLRVYNKSGNGPAPCAISVTLQ